MSYFDRLANFATGNFERVQVRLQEYVPAELEITEAPDFPADRSWPKNVLDQAREIDTTSAPAKSGVEPSIAIRPDTVSPAAGPGTSHHTEFREIHHELIDASETVVTLNQRTEEYKSLIHQIRSEFHTSTFVTSPGPRDVTHTREGERFVRTDRHTERVERFSAAAVPSSNPPSPKATNGAAGKSENSRTITANPEIYVHIGRIDVKVPVEKAETPTIADKPRGVISLEEYLAQRRQG